MRSEKTRRLWLVAGMILMAGEAAADEPTPSPAAPESKYRLAVLDLTPAPGREKAASLALAAVREAATGDDRFDLAPAEDMAKARVMWGEGVQVLTADAQVGSGLDDGSSATMAHPQACAIGHAAGATRLVMLSGYELSLKAAGAAPSGATVRPVVHTEGAPAGAASSVQLAADLTVIDISSCKVRERARVSARGTSAVSPRAALAGARAEFVASARAELQRLLPVHSTVRAVRPNGGEMTHGARDGVRQGQYFAVHRDARAIGHVYVDDVAEDGARVSLVRGVARLEPGDRLVESRAVRVYELGATLTPNVLSRTRADDVFGVAVGGSFMTYKPVGSNIYAIAFERLGLRDFSRIRGGLEIGRQIRILPRRLFAYGLVGLGALRGVQTLRDSAGMTLDRGTMVGFELLNAIGVKYAFGDGLLVHASVSMPVPLYNKTWYYESWSNKYPVPEEMLTYPSPSRLLPTLTLGAGWSF